MVTEPESLSIVKQINRKANEMARFGAMVDMAKTPDEVKDEIGKDMPATASPDAKASVPVYPYGLCISLTEEELPKLGLAGDLPEVGDMIHLTGMARVTSVSENEREMSDGTTQKCCRIELQFTHMSPIENEDDEGRTAARQSRFYGAETKAA